MLRIDQDKFYQQKTRESIESLNKSTDEKIANFLVYSFVPCLLFRRLSFTGLPPLRACASLSLSAFDCAASAVQGRLSVTVLLVSKANSRPANRTKNQNKLQVKIGKLKSFNKCVPISKKVYFLSIIKI